MDETVRWFVDLEIKPGQRDALEALGREMVAAVQAVEPGTLSYEWFIGDDGTCHMHECYADSRAALAHLNWFERHYAARVLPLVTVKRMSVYGDTDAQLRAALDRYGAHHLTKAVGFAR